MSEQADFRLPAGFRNVPKSSTVDYFQRQWESCKSKRESDKGDEAKMTAERCSFSGAATLPTVAAERKGIPITTGVLDYFPDAIAEIARVSKAGSEQHHPGKMLHWDKNKSTDEADSLVRHLIQRGGRDVDGMRHTAKMAWRALALLQREIEADRNQKEHKPKCSCRIEMIPGAFTRIFSKSCPVKGHAEAACSCIIADPSKPHDCDLYKDIRSGL